MYESDLPDAPSGLASDLCSREQVCSFDERIARLCEVRRSRESRKLKVCIYDAVVPYVHTV